MLRNKVQQIDPAKSLKRKFGDKDEWRVVLQQLQEEGALSFTEDRDDRFYWNFGNQTEKNWGFLVRSVFLESAPRVTKRKSVLPSAAKANTPASQSSVEYSDSSDEEAYRRQ